MQLEKYHAAWNERLQRGAVIDQFKQRLSLFLERLGGLQTASRLLGLLDEMKTHRGYSATAGAGPALDLLPRWSDGLESVARGDWEEGLASLEAAASVFPAAKSQARRVKVWLTQHEAYQVRSSSDANAAAAYRTALEGVLTDLARPWLRDREKAGDEAASRDQAREWVDDLEAALTALDEEETLIEAGRLIEAEDFSAALGKLDSAPAGGEAVALWREAVVALDELRRLMNHSDGDNTPEPAVTRETGHHAG
jgi:hypothetical protein